MKKIVLFFVVCFVIGCSSDDSNTSDETGLVGTWLRISYIDEEGNETTEFICPHETIITETTVTARGYYGEDCSLSANAGYSLEYTLDGNFINFELGLEQSSLEILELTSTTLKLKTEEDYSSPGYYITTYTRK